METTLAQSLNSTNTEELDIKDDIEIFEEDLSLKDELVYDDKSELGLGNNTLIGPGDTGQSSLLKCDVCSYETSNEADFKFHKKVHRKTYRCNSCHYRCGNEIRLLNHKKKLHFDLEDLLYFCGDCDFTTRVRATFQQHRRDQHKKEYTGKFQCTNCSFRSDNPKHLDRHSSTHLSMAERRLQCSQCSYSTVSKSWLREHSRKVHSEPFFSCDICGRTYKFSRKGEFDEHVKRHNWPKVNGRFVCKLCDYSALYVRTVMKHIKELHEGQKSTKKSGLKCDKCPFITDKRHLFELHMENHKENKGLHCLRCPYIAFNLSTLGKHNKSYHKEEIIVNNASLGKEADES